MRHRTLYLAALAAMAAAALTWAALPAAGAAAIPATGLAAIAATPAAPLAGADEHPAVAQRAALAQARQAFREGRFPAAYGRFAALADAGHAPSAEITLVMWRHGRALFGSEWSATPVQVRRWTTLVVERARLGPAWAELDRSGD